MCISLLITLAELNGLIGFATAYLILRESQCFGKTMLLVVRHQSCTMQGISSALVTLNVSSLASPLKILNLYSRFIFNHHKSVNFKNWASVFKSATPSSKTSAKLKNQRMFH